MPLDAKALYEKIRNKHISFAYEIHCPKIIEIMAREGRYSAFCVDVGISERTFHNWIQEHEIFKTCYEVAKMFAKELWENDGKALQDIPYEMLGCRFEYWRMMGWSRFGIGKNSRIRLELDPNSTPDKHYSQLIAQAKNGDFTAGEIKQLMEAINVGLKADENFRLQEQLNAIKSDVDKLELSRNGQNSSTTERIAQKSEDTVAGSLCGPINLAE